jgi:hypothetical protein
MEFGAYGVGYGSGAECLGGLIFWLKVGLKIGSRYSILVTLISSLYMIARPVSPFFLRG